MNNKRHINVSYMYTDFILFYDESYYDLCQN